MATLYAPYQERFATTNDRVSAEIKANEQPKTETVKELSRQIQLTRQLLRAVKGIRYGSIEVTVHDSKVVQIERKEKVRL